MKRWSVLFKALSNINRLKIIKMLHGTRGRSVGDIAKELSISSKSTSKHLIILSNLDILEYRGQMNRVLYYLSDGMPEDVRKVLRLFI